MGSGSNLQPKAARWELKFATRTALLFGLLGMVAISVVMVYSLRTAETGLQREIRSSLTQHQQTIVSLINNRLRMLEVYLHSAAARRTVGALSADAMPVEDIAADVAFMFQDANIDARLEVFFLLDPSGKLVMDAGLPLFDIQPILVSLRSPIHYVQGWTLVENSTQSVLLKATPIFDPATVQLRGYLFVGLALGQNRSFISELIGGTQVDLLVLGHADRALAWRGDSERAPQSYATLETAQHDGQGLYVKRFVIRLADVEAPLWLALGVSDKRFASIYDNYLQSFLLLSGGFLLLLIAAAWLLRISHDRAISQLLGFIEATQAGERGLRFQSTGIYEYNRVGMAMQEMVEDLHIAATVFESAEGMVVTDADFQVLRANPAYTRMTGYGEDEVIGRPLDCMLGQGSFTVARDAMLAALAHQGNWQGEMAGRRKNGQEYPQWVSIAVVHGGACTAHQLRHYPQRHHAAQSGRAAH